MKRFKNILFTSVPGVSAASSLERTADLARRNGATLTAVAVVGEAPPRIRRLLNRGESTITHRLLVDRQEAELRSWARSAGSGDADIRVVIDVGSPPFVEIIRRVLRDDHDLVVVAEAAHTDGYASTTKHLLRKCPCPVWVMKPSSPHRRVLAAVDPDPDIAGEAALNDLILELATSIAELVGAELHIVHVWELYGEAALRSSTFAHVPPEELAELVRITESDHQIALERLLSRHDLNQIAHHIHLVKDDPQTAIPAAISEHSIDLVVMGTVARTGIAGSFIGNTAESVLDSTACPVLAVKPEGFITPIELQDPKTPRSPTTDTA